MLFTSYLTVALYVIFVAPSHAKSKSSRKKEENYFKTEDLIKNVSQLFSIASTGGAAELTKKILKQNFEKGELIDFSYKNLKRSPLVGIADRCMCKYLTCNIPICLAACVDNSNKEAKTFDCLACLGECIPVFMRCMSGSEH